MKYLNLCSILFLFSIFGANATTYREDLVLIGKQTDFIELKAADGKSRLCVAPEFQGRALVASLEGSDGESLGWINRTNWRSGELNSGGAAGGVDRLWIGPLGSQFAFYYQQIKPLSDGNWSVPAPMNSEPYELTSFSSNAVRMKKHMQLTNFIGTEFDLEIDRMIWLLDEATVTGAFGVNVNDRPFVAFESRNTLTNRGDEAWSESTGIPSLWSLGMYQGTDDGVLFIPLKEGVDREVIVEYLSEADQERIEVKDGILFYKCDGKLRNKIGIPPEYCGRIWGSYHPENQVLTLVRYQFDPEAARYFNSDATVQGNPFSGEPVQVYNHGPMDLSVGEENLFYEMETTSSAEILSPNDSISHWHQVLMMKCDRSFFENILHQVCL